MSEISQLINKDKVQEIEVNESAVIAKVKDSESKLSAARQ